MSFKFKQILLVGILAIGTLFFASQTANAQRFTKRVFARKFVDGDAKDVKVAFSPTDKVVFCVIGLDAPAPNAVFKFVWKFQQTEVYQQELTNQSGKNIVSKLSVPKGLNEGHYEVDLFVDGRPRGQLRFPVVKDQF